jgi:Rad3-related DNA helicase
LVTSKDDKASKLEQFKKNGGLLIGCGMAEGIDLPGDLCRLLIIPRLLYPNRGDQAVKKELMMPDGELFYGLDTFLTTVQQLGRGVRGKDDWCESLIMDPTWPRLAKQHGIHVHKEFMAGLIF